MLNVKSASILVAVALSGCGGGSNSVVFRGGYADFVSWSATPANATIELQGSGVVAETTQALNGNMNANDGNDDGAITVAAASGPQAATARLRIEGGVPTRIELSSGGTTAAVSDADGTISATDPIVAQSTLTANRTRIRTADPNANGFEYQNYGTWVTGLNNPTGSLGAGTTGVKTTGTQTVDGTYNGSSLGLAVDKNTGELWETQSTVQVTTSQNFTKSDIQSSATSGERLNGAAGVAPLGNLDFASTASGDIANNAFVAPISGAHVSGATDGTFYGPTATEVGGTFTSSTADWDYLGSYGATK
ncbi:transferrin-binding protein-like solute binding protein [Ovoidimarina sediminis]|uniref:transferrin-binding protein-like solute binding protein n=1 Tax=Ovoidimarina sediminis TaxID=3079856 RepID=UPI0029133776|nr:transferrin-binding protein-like solute binding protein [Rhodophyticola sp. MJ-SS7]MDU8946467.1 transferrin-binding protein-like solute binding protein [Rhodophyticola sp. MJ-SS7]